MFFFTQVYLLPEFLYGTRVQTSYTGKVLKIGTIRFLSDFNFVRYRSQLLSELVVQLIG